MASSDQSGRMSRERAAKILNDWSRYAAPDLKPTPERVRALVGVEWAQWCEAHRVIFPRRKDV